MRSGSFNRRTRSARRRPDSTGRRDFGHNRCTPSACPSAFRPRSRVSSVLLERPTSATLPIDTRPRGVPLLLLLGILTAIASLSIDMYLPALPAIAADLRAAPGLL